MAATKRGSWRMLKSYAAVVGVCVLGSLPTPRAREERLVLVAADLRGPPLQLLVAAAGVHYHSLGLLGGARGARLF